MRMTQNHIEHLQDMLQRGEMTAEQANVEKVKMARVQLVTCRMPSDVRKALNAAVKRGELCHLKKEGHKPEAYYHPNFEYMAKADRKAHEQSVYRALQGVLSRPVLID